MITRVYLNRRRGEERIHVEIDAEDIPRLLTSLQSGPDATAEALALRQVLVEALHAFGQDWPGAA